MKQAYADIKPLKDKDDQDKAAPNDDNNNDSSKRLHTHSRTKILRKTRKKALSIIKRIKRKEVVSTTK